MKVGTDDHVPVVGVALTELVDGNYNHGFREQINLSRPSSNLRVAVLDRLVLIPLEESCQKFRWKIVNLVAVRRFLDKVGEVKVDNLGADVMLSENRLVVVVEDFHVSIADVDAAQ